MTTKSTASDLRISPKLSVRKYFDEALGLGIFMFSAGFFDALIDYPGLPIRQHISSSLLRRFLIGLSMGFTALYIFTSRFGKQSGAYINPAVTIVWYRLGQINKMDSFYYILFQFLGGSLGMELVVLLFPKWMKHPEINYIITVPGAAGVAVAFVMEFLISLVLILVVLRMGDRKNIEKYTPVVVATLITLYITFEAPFSGMSMNPARTFASAVVANQWKSFWLYCTAPLLGMWVGSSLYLRSKK
ncbi:MAG: aquaporin [Bacteroidota bacterium]